MFCRKCGTEIKAGAAFCSKCGQPTGQSKPEDKKTSSQSDINTQFETAKSKVTAAVNKTRDSASAFASEAKKSGEEKKKSFIDKRIEKESKAKKEANQEPTRIISLKDLDRYISKEELWGDLKRSSKRAKYLNEEAANIQEDEFMTELQKQVDENKVPVRIEKKPVLWDKYLAKEEIYFATSKDIEINPISFLVQFNHVGNYTFVEEKTFITPPNLPKEPDEKVDVPDKFKASILVLIIGIILCCVGIMVLPLLFVGIILACIGGYGVSNVVSRRAHNKKCEEEAREYALAWRNWEDFVLVYGYQDEIDGKVARLNDAISDCIKQTSEKLLKSAPVATEVEQFSYAELSQRARANGQEALQKTKKES